tara:strand:+ start:32942 stop:33757 length:816 start_codon:yes stop_codon:yes gene_type:complete
MLHCLLAVFPMLWASGVGAENNPVLDDAFTFKIGAIHNEIDGDITIGRDPLPVTPIDVVDVLKIDNSEILPWLAFRWRFAERWSLNFRFNGFEESGGNVVSEEFNLDGVVYPVGVQISTDLRADAYILDVSYNLLDGDNYELGLGLGVHAFDFNVAVQGALMVGDSGETFGGSSESLIAPVPNLRIYGTYAFGPKTSITFNAGWLSLEYDDYDGAFYYLESHVEYRFTNHWGVGAGAQFTDMDFEHDSGAGDFERFDISFTGLQGYVTYSF